MLCSAFPKRRPKCDAVTQRASSKVWPRPGRFTLTDAVADRAIAGVAGLALAAESPDGVGAGGMCIARVGARGALVHVWEGCTRWRGVKRHALFAVIVPSSRANQSVRPSKRCQRLKAAVPAIATLTGAHKAVACVARHASALKAARHVGAFGVGVAWERVGCLALVDV
jgi:hypothetical protein